MGKKMKYSPIQKVQACIDCLPGKKAAVEIARELGMRKYGDDQIREWSKMYQAYSSSAFEETDHNKSYSKEFKEKIAQEYLKGNGSLRDLTVKYSIPSSETLAYVIF